MLILYLITVSMNAMLFGSFLLISLQRFFEGQVLFDKDTLKILTNTNILLNLGSFIVSQEKNWLIPVVMYLFMNCYDEYITNKATAFGIYLKTAFAFVAVAFGDYSCIYSLH